MGRLVESTCKALGPTGPIARALSRAGSPFEAREGQLAMAGLVAEGIEQARVVLCEAGTGTGKTLAYLVPALLSGQRVVVSTASKALQEQIYTKDLPLLATHLGVDVTASLMKGLGNYLCRRRLSEALVMAMPGDSRTEILGQIEAWSKQSNSGDRVELTMLRDDDPAWREVQSGSDTRIGQPCPHYASCFVTKMREEAQKSRLVVVNHHLYLADLAIRRGGSRQGVIPPHDVVIFDEAHQLEEIATDFFGVRLSTARIESTVRDARRTLASAGKIPIRATIEKLPILGNVLSAMHLLFGALASAQGLAGQDTRVPLPHEAWAQSADARSKLDAALEGLSLLCKQHESGQEEIAATTRRVITLRNDLARVAVPTEQDVPWIEIRSRSISVGVSPLELSTVFRKELFAVREGPAPRTIVLTSATLATGNHDHPFHHLKRRLGIAPFAARKSQEFDVDEVDGRMSDAPSQPTSHAESPLELVVDSPFDYPRHAGLYVPLDLPEPREPAFVDQAASRIVELVRASAGGVFVLTTSARNMRHFRDALALASLPYPLLCQGDQPKTTLLERFRSAGNAVLVATMGFWEGIDVPGRALRLVVLDKIPFAIPTDPVVAARSRAIEARGGSAFAELSLPDAAIALKQGFGRLIRTRSDTGVVAIFDRRMRTKGYGRSLMSGLPPARQLHDLAAVRAFFAEWEG